MMNKNKHGGIKRNSVLCIVNVLLFPLFKQHTLLEVTAERRAGLSNKGINSRSIDCYLWPLITVNKAETGNLTNVTNRLNFELVVLK